MIRDKPEDYDWHQKLDKPQDIITYLWYTDSDDAKAKNPETTTPKTSKTIKADAMKQADVLVEEAGISIARSELLGTSDDTLA